MKPVPKVFTKNVGVTTGLMFVVNQSQALVNIDLSYKWLALQSGQHYVDSTINGTPISPGTEQWAGYLGQRFQIAEDARSLSDELKQCRMSDVPLKYFPIYNRQYCLLECEMARTLQRCRCVRVVHPSPPGTARCRARRLKCAKRAAETTNRDECDCPNACDIDIDDVMMENYDLILDAHSYDDFYKDLDFQKVTVVRSFIMDHQPKVFARKSYYDSLNLFSQLGGVFSVFFGCSILTLLELLQLVYYSLRARRSAKVKPQGSDKVPRVSKKKKEIKIAKDVGVAKIKRN